MKKLLLLSLTIICFSVSSTQAQQEGFIGEVKMFAGSFTPRGWALCQGQILPINTNTALFSIIGTTYGGDGRTTFALPDLRGRVPVGPGRSPGLSSIKLGQKFGTEITTLNNINLPSHNHRVSSYSANPNDATKGKFIPGSKSFISVGNESNSSTNTSNTSNTSNTGGKQPLSNTQPSLGINFIICTQGIFPSRS